MTILDRIFLLVTGLIAIYLIVYFVKRQKDSCLLYTSPSPRDLSTSRMPSSA